MMSKPVESKLELKLTKKITEGRSGTRVFDGPKDFPPFKTIEEFLAKER